MRKELGVLLMEDQVGGVTVQLFAETAGVEKAFANLAGHPASPPARATLISLRYGEDGEVNVATMSKMIPVVDPVENRPDGYVLGEGPVKFPDSEAKG